MRKALPWLVLAAIVAFLAYKLHASHFDARAFVQSVRTADFRLIALAVLLIHAQNLIRALRWRVFLKPSGNQTPWYALIGSQFIGFTGLAIFGRIGELIRPLLVSRRTGLPFPSQVALVTVERVFDLGAFGAIFAINLLVSPTLQQLPYLHKAGYTIAGLTVVIALFVAAVRLAGTLMANLTRAIVGIASKPAGQFCADKIIDFRAGLNVIGSVADFLLAALLSLLLWATIAAAYVLTLRAFPAPVHSLGTAATIVLMGFSIAGSALPIPGGGGAWAGNSFALGTLFKMPTALAASAGLMVWLVTTLSIIPAGLVFAKAEGISLTQVTKTSEAAEEMRD